jgi:hypothetical protein
MPPNGMPARTVPERRADRPAREAGGQPVSPGAAQGYAAQGYAAQGFPAQGYPAAGAGPGGRGPGPRPSAGGMVPSPRPGGRGSGEPAGNGRALAPPGPARPAAARPAAARTEHRRWGLARVAIRTAAGSADASRTAAPPRPAPRAEAALPWYEIAEGNRTAAGWRDCGSLESVLHREWADTAPPPPEAVTAIDRLADLPRLIKDRLVAGLDAIHVGGGGVPDLDDMSRLSGVSLPSGRATWDACAGAYGERKIVVGSRPSPTPDVMCHEIGHALDDIDGQPGHWQSDSDEFCVLYEHCLPHLMSNLHRQRGVLGRREFFADAFAAIASRQRPALVDMLGGDTRSALNVMLYFNMRYGI